MTNTERKFHGLIEGQMTRKELFEMARILNNRLSTTTNFDLVSKIVLDLKGIFNALEMEMYEK